MSKREKYDGRSRPSNKAYDESWHRIFGSNPVALEVRTPKFKSQVVVSRKYITEKEMITDKDAKEFHKMIKKLEEQNKFKKEQDELKESYKQSKKNKKERDDKKK